MKETELLNCWIEKLQRTMILTTPRNGNGHQVFLNQENALGLLSERAGGVVYVHKSIKIVVRVIQNSFCSQKVPVRVSSYNSSEGIRYMETISKAFHRNYTVRICNLLYSNALELQNRSWITHGLRLGMVHNPDEMPNHRVNVNCLSTVPIDGLLNDNGHEFSKKAQRLRHSRKIITGREVFLG